MPAEGPPLSACRKVFVKSLDAAKLDSHHLRLDDLFYSEVDSIHVEMDLENMSSDSVHPYQHIWDAIVGRQHIDTEEKEHTVKTLARTLIVGCNSQLDNIVSASVPELDNYYLDFLRVLLCLEEEPDYGKVMNKLSTEDRFYAEAKIVYTGRRVFQTTKGTFGLGPACMGKGDIVVVLFGGNTPYILRPNDATYHFMGQAYVDELMQGELVDAMEAGLIQEREFCLI